MAEIRNGGKNFNLRFGGKKSAKDTSTTTDDGRRTTTMTMTQKKHTSRIGPPVHHRHSNTLDAAAADDALHLISTHHDGPSTSRGNASPTTTDANANGRCRPTAATATTSRWCRRRSIGAIGHVHGATTVATVRSGQARATASRLQHCHPRRGSRCGTTKVQPNLTDPRLPRSDCGANFVGWDE